MRDTLYSLLNHQVEPQALSIEISSRFQIPGFQIIGLPGPEVSEAKDRIQTALENSGFEFPNRKVILNLSPASIRKQGTGLDLAMALAVILHSDEKSDHESPLRITAWGELGLDGSVKGIGQCARTIAAALKVRSHLLFLSEDDREDFLEKKNLFSEESLRSVRVIFLGHLEDLHPWIESRTGVRRPPRMAVIRQTPPTSELSLSPTVPLGSSVPSSSREPKTSALLPLPPELHQTLLLAASGRHHLLLLGPRGVGKSHALEWLTYLLPEPEIDTRRIQVFLSELCSHKPRSAVRRVGSQVKAQALIGSVGFHGFQPGEFSLAHGGMILADEFPEWHRDAREAFREPLERSEVTLTRTQGSYSLPSRFLLAANGNLCPCGGIFQEKKSAKEKLCRCLPQERVRYLSRLSGPILDRIDLVRILSSSRAPALKKTLDPEALREEVAQTQKLLRRKYGDLPGSLAHSDLENLLTQNPRWKERLETATFESLRDRHKILRIAMTLAALQKEEEPGLEHFLEAKLYRGRLPLDP